MGSTIEKEGLLHSTTTNLIEVAYIQTPDCVCGVVAMAINALTETRSREITGFDIQQIVQETGLPKEELDSILAEAGKKFGTQDVVMKTLIDIPLDVMQMYQLYASLIDNGSLVFIGVDARPWYRMVGYPGSIEEVQHSLLINGYQTRMSKYFGRRQSASVYARDPNLRRQLLVSYGKLRGVIAESLKSDTIFFCNKNNQNIGKVQIPIP